MPDLFKRVRFAGSRRRNDAYNLIRLIHEKPAVTHIPANNRGEYGEAAAHQAGSRPPMRWFGPGTLARYKPSGALLGFDRRSAEPGVPNRKPGNYRACEDLDSIYLAKLGKLKYELLKKEACEASLVVRRGLHEEIFRLIREYRDADKPRRSWAALIHRRLQIQGTLLSARQIRNLVTNFNKSGSLQTS